MNARGLAVAAALLMAVSVIATGAGGFVGNARAATLVVDDDGADCPGAGHTTITSAVASASSFDTIQVCSGTYNESVDIGVENLRLIANGSAVLDANATKGVAFRVEADDVWIEGFEMRNYTSHVIRVPNNGPFSGYHRTTITDNLIWISGPGAGKSTAGIVFRDKKSNGITITNNVILDAPGGPTTRGVGVDVRATGSCSTCNRNGVIENNTITARNQGIQLGGGAPGSVIRNNTVTVHQDSQGGGWGIRVWRVRFVEVSGNDVTVLDSDIHGIRASVEEAGNLTIENNAVHGGDYGVLVHVDFNAVTDPNNPVVVRSNDVSNTADDGIRVIDVDGTRVVDNTIMDPGDKGIVLADADDLDASGNVVTGALNGIRLQDSQSTVIEDNRLDGSDIGLDFRPGTGHAFATGNVITNGTTSIRVEGLVDSRLRDNVVSNASSAEVRWVGRTPNTTVTNLTLDSGVIDFEAADTSLQAVETPPTDPLGQGNVGQHIEATSLSGSAFLNLTTTYSDGAATDVNESTIALWTFDGSSWSEVTNSTVDADANRVGANVTSFGTIAPLGTLTDSTAPDLSNLSVAVVDTRTISMSLDSNESLAVIEVKITNEAGSVVETLTADDFGSVGAGPIEYFAQPTLASAGHYTVTLTNASDRAVNDGSSGENATVQLVVEDVTVRHVNGTAPIMANLTSNVYLAQGPGGLLQVQLRDASDPTADLVNRTDLENLGVKSDTTLAINVTLVDWTPRLLLGTGHNLTWTSDSAGANATTLNLTVQPAEAQLIESQLVNPEEPWPTGADDRADIRLNATVDLAVDDMSHLADPVQRDVVDGTILATDAQAFGTPQYDSANTTLGLFVAGPHLTVDGENHTGFYDAFLPDALLDEWGVEDASELTVAYQGDPIDFAAQNVDGGIELAIDITYSAGDVAISRTDPESDTEPEPEPEPAPPSASDPDPVSEPDDESEGTKTVEIDDTQDNVTVRKTVVAGNASANATVSLDVSVEPEDDPENATEEHPVTLDRLNVTMNRTSDVSLTITESAAPPTEDSATFERTDGTQLLGYIRIDHELDDADVSEVELEFRVRKALLDEAGDDPEHVALYRLEGNEWAELPTTLTGETDTHYVFRAVSPGLSEFATGAKRAKFEIAQAKVSVTELRTGDDFEVLVRITNVGGADGTYTVELWIEADQIAEQTVTVAANGTRQVTFDHEFETPGSYEVRVNDRSTGQIHVLEVTPTPTEATPSPQPAGTPDATDTEPPDEPITIPLPGFGMDVALVALAMATLLAVWRRD